MTEGEFEEFIAAHAWTFARSMPKIPHCYVVRKKCRDDAEFERAVCFIRETGYHMPWRRYKQIYRNQGEHFYWTMGAPPPETTIINRALFVDYPYHPTGVIEAGARFNAQGERQAELFESR